MKFFIGSGGVVRCLYGEAVDLHALGRLRVSRVSRVEPDVEGLWWATVYNEPPNYAQLGPFTKRSEALAAEAALIEDRLAKGGGA